MKVNLILLISVIKRAQVEDYIQGYISYEDFIPCDEHENRTCHNFLTFKEPVHPPDELIKMSEFTACIRIKVLTYNGGGLHLFGGNEPDDSAPTDLPFQKTSRNLHTDVSAPGGVWESIIRMDTYKEGDLEIAKANGLYVTFVDYKKDINSYEWHHICQTMSIKNLIFAVVHNGYTVDNRTQPKIWGEVENYVPSTIFQPKFEEKDEHHYGFALAANFFGYFADFNIWKRSLTREEMYAWTTCELFETGDFYSWDVDSWVPLNVSEGIEYPVRVVNISKSELCIKPAKYFFLPDNWLARPALKLCKTFGGKLVNLTTQEQYDEVLKYTNSVRKDPAWDMENDQGIAVWTRWADEKESNVWIDIETGEKPEIPLIWAYAEPNGMQFENCAHMVFGKIPTEDDDEEEEPDPSTFEFWGKLIDSKCDQGHRAKVICEDVPNVLLRLRGHCESTKLDVLFNIRHGFIEKNTRYFTGNFGWQMSWNDTDDLFMIKNVKYPYIYAHTDEKYPFGKREWTIVNDTCSTEETEKKVLNLSPCDSSSFTCDDGICIPMTSRCDQKLDCEDVSDEKNCKIVILDEKSYLKDKPPPPLGGLGIVDVKIRMELYNILEISEVTSVFRTQYKLFMEWKDPRITFWNLKNDTTLNIMTSSEKESIWMPTLMFFNTDKKSRTITDQETLVYIKKGGQFSSMSQMKLTTFIFMRFRRTLS